MDRGARLPIDCPRCENRGHIDLGDDDVRLPCPLCNNWCMLCLDDVPTFVPIIRPYRGSLIAGIRPTAKGETLFEGYACDYHKVGLQSYSYIAPPMAAFGAWLEVRGHGARALFGRLNSSSCTVGRLHSQPISRADA